MSEALQALRRLIARAYEKGWDEVHISEEFFDTVRRDVQQQIAAGGVLNLSVGNPGHPDGYLRIDGMVVRPIMENECD